MARKPKDWRQGERVRIDARLSDRKAADETDAEYGEPLHLRDELGHVVGATPSYKGHDGVDRVMVQLDTGGIVSAPEKALRKNPGKRSSVGFSMTQGKYESIFGHAPRSLDD